MKSKAVYIGSHHAITPLGHDSYSNFAALQAGKSSVRVGNNPWLSDQPICASLFQPEDWNLIGAHIGNAYTRFEQLIIRSVQQVLAETDIQISNPRTVFILATTKGNIEKISTRNRLHEGLPLHNTAKKIGEKLGYHSIPLTVSHACISGMTALITARRLILSGFYDHAVVAGADCISPFIYAGFQSFQALSAEPSRPFDVHRKGINLGEGVASMVLSNRETQFGLQLLGGAISNDANHISGPSRTGRELAEAISKTMKICGVKKEQIGFISAHGTATLYNDEMEAKAFALAELTQVPVNSLKAYFGHTLGAAGLLESVMSLIALEKNQVIQSKGYSQHGVSQPICLSKNWISKSMSHVLKTGSGFGGCNAAIIFNKTN